MAICSMCGDKYGILGGGPEIVTGQNLKVCNNCGHLLNTINESCEKYDEEHFNDAMNRIQKQISGSERETFLEYCNRKEYDFSIKKSEAVAAQELEETKSKARSEKIATLRTLAPTRVAGALYINDTSGNWYIGEFPEFYEAYNDSIIPEIYALDSVVEVKVLQGQSITTETTTGGQNVSSTLGRAIVGGVLSGGTGAIVGAMTGTTSSESVTTTFNTYDLAIFFKNSSVSFTCSNELLAREMETAMNDSIRKSKLSASDDPYSEIRSLKGLLDDGIISQEEFEAKKKQLLGI